MPDMNIFENILCGYKLDVMSHFILSQLPYSKKENYAFKFNINVFYL